MAKQLDHRTTWSKYCSICMYMKTHKDFHLAIMNSQYFNVHGVESIPAVLRRYHLEKMFTPQHMYNHFKAHQKKDRERFLEQTKQEEERDRLEKREIQKKTGTVSVGGVFVDELGEDYKSEHQVGLDEFISAGRAKLQKNNMTISAATYLQAIKIKAEIESKGKDRKLDVFKTLFKGASPADLATKDATGTEDDRPSFIAGQPTG